MNILLFHAASSNVDADMQTFLSTNSVRGAEEQERQFISWGEPEYSVSDDGGGAVYTSLIGLLSARDKTRDFYPETDKAECQINPKDGE